MNKGRPEGTAHPAVVRDPTTLVLQFRGAQHIHRESKSLVKQLGARVRGSNIEGSAATSRVPPILKT
jgi:hypothetical protein